MNEIITTKICTKCKVEKEKSEFNNHTRSKDGLRSQCRKCEKDYYQINKDKINLRNRIHHQNNKERMSHRSKLYYELNKNKIFKYRLANKDKISKNSREYRIDNREKLIDYSKKYSKTPKGRLSLKNSRHKRRSKLKQGDVTTKQLLLLEQNAKKCYWCNKPLKNLVINVDHYTPLAKGGEHTISNLVVSCQSCNNIKKAKDPIIFANSLGRLL